eukprot:Gb_23415 [translate_table: standard]
MLTELIHGFYWVLRRMLRKSKFKKQVQTVEDRSELPFLDLPELVLESIFRRLPPQGLCQLSRTCRDLRKRCRSDEIWEPLFRERWGEIVGPSALTAWHRMVRRENACNLTPPAKQASAWMRSLTCIWPFLKIKSTVKCPTPETLAFAPNERFAALYSALENGKLWFPAQVYNRDHGHDGFMLSCYDAELNYDRTSDIFCARYSPHCATLVVREDGVSWERIRRPPVETSANELHIPDVPEELRPGDHIEVQWKKSQVFPYGWWYGIVGHADNCKRENQHCRCYLDDVLCLEFRQYTRGSRWRQIQIKRKRIREDGNEAEGFYGGIRKLYSKDEISSWLRLWPRESLE